MNECICKICGYDIYPDKFRGGDTPTYIICPCCGAESGYEDSTPKSIENCRQKWIDNQMIWFDKSIKPANWDFKQQIENIKKKN